MTPKKPYTPPKIYEVELNQEQAILAVCSSSSANLAAGATRKCRTGNCRQASSSGDNAGRAS